MKNHIKTYLFILLFICTSTIGKSQIDINKITDTYWGVMSPQLSNLTLNDTLILKKFKSDKSMSQPYNNGFILMDNGQFREIMKKTCSQSRPPKEGVWSIKENHVVLSIDMEIWIEFDIIDVAKKSLVTNHWSL